MILLNATKVHGIGRVCFGREESRALLYWKKMDRKVAVAAAACVLSNSDNGDKVDSEWMHQ